VSLSQLYTRFTLKDRSGKEYDEVIINLAGSSWSSDLFNPKSKIGFLIDKQVYNEDEFKSLPADITCNIKFTSTTRLADPALFPGINVKGYTSIISLKTVTPEEMTPLNYP
jgi:hypothetical protein